MLFAPYSRFFRAFLEELVFQDTDSPGMTSHTLSLKKGGHCVNPEYCVAAFGLVNTAMWLDTRTLTFWLKQSDFSLDL